MTSKQSLSFFFSQVSSKSGVLNNIDSFREGSELYHNSAKSFEFVI